MRERCNRRWERVRHRTELVLARQWAVSSSTLAERSKALAKLDGRRGPPRRTAGRGCKRRAVRQRHDGVRGEGF